jgi:hypothetical protein
VRKTLFLLPLLLLSACVNKPYYHVSVMNLNGDLVAAWTARGHVWHTWDGLYSIDAVERFSPAPAQKFEYPLGWRVHIGGPNMVIYRVEEPEWLKNQNLLDVSDNAEAKAGVSQQSTVYTSSKVEKDSASAKK